MVFIFIFFKYLYTSLFAAHTGHIIHEINSNNNILSCSYIYRAIYHRKWIYNERICHNVRVRNNGNKRSTTRILAVWIKIVFLKKKKKMCLEKKWFSHGLYESVPLALPHTYTHTPCHIYTHTHTHHTFIY